MSFTVTDQGGLRRVSLGLRSAQQQFWPLLQTHIDALGTETATQLAEASPIGTGLHGKSVGQMSRNEDWRHLSQSFVSRAREHGVDVLTTQADKLRYVRYGTGIYGKFGTPIVPVEKQAMWWPEAGYPRLTVAGQKPNDFVTPVLNDVTQYAVDALMQFAHQVALLIEGT